MKEDFDCLRMECDKGSVETDSMSEEPLKVTASLDEEKEGLDDKMENDLESEKEKELEDEMKNDLESEKEKTPETSPAEGERMGTRGEQGFQELGARENSSDGTTVAKKTLQELKKSKVREEPNEVAKGEIQDLDLVQKCASNDDEEVTKHSGLGSPVRKAWGRESFSPVREVWGEEAFNKREEEEMEIEMEEEEKDVEKEMEEEEEMDGEEFEKQKEAGHTEDHVRSTGKRNLRK